MTTMSRESLYTVGHSNQTQEDFLDLLRSQNINCIIEVISMPYSKYTPQFNSEVLKAFLKNEGILYAHFGEEFGARRTDCLKETIQKKKGAIITIQQVNFELGIKTANFLHGAERVKKALSQGRCVSLMCSEADPLGCHRFSFISRFFYDLGWNVNHIMRCTETAKPILVDHKTLEQRMIMNYVSHKKLKSIGGQTQLLFSDFGDGYTEEQQRIDAYRLKNQEIGWSPTTLEENQ